MSAAAAAATERPPTPPRSNDGENGLPDGPAQSQPDEPYTPPRLILPASKLEDTLVVSDHKAPAAEHSTRHHDPYGDPSLYQTAAPANTFYPIQPTFVRTTQLQTPPMTYDDGRIHTRSGRALGSPLSPTFRNIRRVMKLPRVKSTSKALKKSKAAKTGAPLIEEPLSILTKDYKIPVKDMDVWVHRSASERLEQAVKNKNHISRPMNSFMLYRSAYADRAKHFCKENNHQIVSQITGASWPLEPKKIREMYEEFARIERDAHQKAHPDYKFAPNKSGSKKHRFDDDDDDDDDPEWHGPRIKRSQTGTTGQRRSVSSTPFDDRFQPPYQPTPHPSSFWASNPHGQPPMGMGPESYYQPIVNQYNQQVENIEMRPMQYLQYDQGSLIGLPNNNHAALLRDRYPRQMNGDMLDPQLAGGEQQYRYSHYETADPGYDAPRSYQYGYPVTGQQYYEAQPPSFHPGMATLTDSQEDWEEHGQPGAAFDEAFQRWS